MTAELAEPQRIAVVSSAWPPDGALGSLALGLVPRQPCPFRLDSARSLHAALLRRLERRDPRLAVVLHEAPGGAHTVTRPWTLSSLRGAFARQDGAWIARPTSCYWARVTALTPQVLAGVRALLDELADVSRRGTAPLELEHVPFDVVGVEPSPPASGEATPPPGWNRTTSYATLLALARPAERICLAWLSPTAFRRGAGHATRPEPRLCLASYLRRWNAFAPAELRLAEAPLLDYVDQHVALVDVALREQWALLGRFRVFGQVGRLTWQCAPGSDALVRQVNALADYAYYCGTGIKPALGMGQTVRLASGGSTR